MPGEGGLSLARFLRAEKQVGIIMLTAAGEVVDRIVGLEMGAEDYLAKPVNLRELLARIKAVLRRTDRAAAEDESEPPEGTRLARFDRVTLNLDSHKLFDTTDRKGTRLDSSPSCADRMPSSCRKIKDTTKETTHV